jgi:hypothetical protein
MDGRGRNQRLPALSIGQRGANTMSVDTGVCARGQGGLPTARIVSYEGATDGLRFGTVYFGGGQQGFSRTFLWDRLADAVYLSNNRSPDGVPDLDPARVAACAGCCGGARELQGIRLGWEAPVDKAEHLLVLLALADIANDAGKVRAGAAYLAKKCRREERAIRRSLLALDELGVIEILDRPGKAPLITLAIPDEFMIRFGKDQELEAGKRGRPLKPPSTVEKPPLHGGGKPPSMVSDEPKTEPKKEPGEGVDAREIDPFDEWWKVYPLHVAKAAARKAFWVALSKFKCDTPLTAIIEATRRFAEEVSDRPRDKIPHPATWLNGERWNDEPDANRSQTDARRNLPTSPDRGAERHARNLGAMQLGAAEAANGRGGRRWRL